MIRNILGAAIASAAITLAGPALADPGGGGHGGGGPGGGAGANVNVNVPAGVPNQNALDARVNSQGPTNASPTGIENASPNSVLKTNSTTTTTTTAVRGRGVMASALPNLATGLTVRNSAGTTIGTISRIVTDARGTIRAVLVTSTSGRTFRLEPSTLSIDAGVVTTTSM
jgi:hypothetical protein